MTHLDHWRQTPDNGREHSPNQHPDHDANPQRDPGGPPAGPHPSADVAGALNPPQHAAAAPAPLAPGLDPLADPGDTQPSLPSMPMHTESVITPPTHPGTLQILPPTSGPLDHPPHAAGVASQSPNSFWRSSKRRPGVKLLIVENEYSNRRLMEHILELAGYECFTASNGAEALTVFDRERPDLVLTDIAMPIMDGLEATAALRARPEGARIPIVGVSAFAMPGDRERALYGGCNAYLTKPYRPQDLLELVGRLLEELA